MFKVLRDWIQRYFSDEEADVVRHALTAYLSDLRMEVHATDSYDMREELNPGNEAATEAIESLSGR